MLSTFVLSGLQKIKTEAMKKTIIQAFADHGRFEEMRRLASTIRIEKIESLPLPLPAYANEIETAQQIDRIGIVEDDDEGEENVAPNEEDEEDSDSGEEDSTNCDDVAIDARALVLKLGLHGILSTRNIY